jgi:hypothetical protein
VGETLKRPYGTGQIYEKWGAYYARWRTPDGRRLNRRLGPKRKPGSSDGLTRPQAERAFRRIQAEDRVDRLPRCLAAVTTEDVERLASRVLARRSSPETVRNVMTFLHSILALAVKKGWAPSNPVEEAARPKRRRAGDADPYLQFLARPSSIGSSTRSRIARSTRLPSARPCGWSC